MFPDKSLFSYINIFLKHVIIKYKSERTRQAQYLNETPGRNVDYKMLMN